MNRALEVDASCEFAYETLGTIEIQRQELPSPLDDFDNNVRSFRLLFVNQRGMQRSHCYLYHLLTSTPMRAPEEFGLDGPLCCNIWADARL